jgi:hypothetical protein
MACQEAQYFWNERVGHSSKVVFNSREQLIRQINTLQSNLHEQGSTNHFDLPYQITMKISFMMANAEDR